MDAEAVSAAHGTHSGQRRVVKVTQRHTQQRVKRGQELVVLGQPVAKHKVGGVGKAHDHHDKAVNSTVM